MIRFEPGHKLDEKFYVRQDGIILTNFLIEYIYLLIFYFNCIRYKIIFFYLRRNRKLIHKRFKIIKQ